MFFVELPGGSFTVHEKRGCDIVDIYMEVKSTSVSDLFVEKSSRESKIA